MVDLWRLRILRELAQRGTMAAAAEALFLSASAVSQQISQLERETGIRLIERHGRRVRLTPAGERLVSHANRLFVIVEEAQAELATIKKEITGTLRASAFASAAGAIMPKAMLNLQRRHPRLDVTLQDLEPLESLAALRSWQVDVALIDDLIVPPDPSDQGIERQALLTDSLLVVLPVRHPLAQRKFVKLSDLADEDWALNEQATTYYQMIVAACRAAGFEPRIRSSCRNVSVTFAMVGAGCAVSILPRLWLAHHDRSVCVKKLMPAMHRNISVAIRRGSSKQPAVQAMLQELRDACQPGK